MQEESKEEENERDDGASQAPPERCGRSTRDPSHWWDPMKMLVLFAAGELESGQHETLAWSARAFVWIGEIAVNVYKKFRR